MYLNGVKLDAVNSVHTPSEAAHRLGSVFVPDVNLLTTRCKHGILPVMINTMIKSLMKRQELFNNYSSSARWI